MNINTNQSKTKIVLCCVPHGSNLGPLIFLIFINDIPLNFGNSIQSVDLYADDMTLYDIGLDQNMLENDLQHPLNLLQNLVS